MNVYNNIYIAQGTIWHWTSLDLIKILLCIMLTLLKNMNHLSHLQIYFAVVCAAFFFKGISVGCSNPQTHKPPEWKHKDQLVCTDKEQKHRDPAISLHPRFPSLSLFIVSSSVITSASSLFPFLLIHNSNVAQIRRGVLAQQPALRHSGLVLLP